MRFRLASVASAILAMATLVPLTGYGQTSDETTLHEGLQLRRERRDAEALAVFERALAVDGSARTRAQVGLAEHALGFWAEAERDIAGALADGEGPWFEERRPTLLSALDAVRGHLATLTVTVDVRGAEIWVDDVRAGIAPLEKPLRVVSGNTNVRAVAPGYAAQTKTLLLTSRSGETVGLHLEKVLQPASSPTVTGRSSTSAPGAAMRALAWTSAGASIALLAGSGVSWGVRQWAVGVYNDDTRCFFGSLTRNQRCGGYVDIGQTAERLAFVQLGVAVATLGVSIVAFTLAPRPAETSNASLQCSVGSGVLCHGSF